MFQCSMNPAHFRDTRVLSRYRKTWVCLQLKGKKKKKSRFVRGQNGNTYLFVMIVILRYPSVCADGDRERDFASFVSLI